MNVGEVQALRIRIQFQAATALTGCGDDAFDKAMLADLVGAGLASRTAWWHSSRDATAPPSKRMLPSVIGGPGRERG
jgi:hypothetical protein